MSVWSATLKVWEEIIITEVLLETIFQQKYYWRPSFNRSTIGDHLSWDTHQGRLSHWRPQSVHWRPQDFNRKPPRFWLKTRDFDWRPQILIEDPQIFIGDTQFFIGDPRIFMGDPKFFIVDPRFALETGGLQIFIGNTNDDNYFPDSLKVHSQWCVFKIVSRKCAFKVCPESVSSKCNLRPHYTVHIISVSSCVQNTCVLHIHASSLVLLLFYNNGCWTKQ